MRVPSSATRPCLIEFSISSYIDADAAAAAAGLPMHAVYDYRERGGEDEDRRSSITERRRRRRRQVALSPAIFFFFPFFSVSIFFFLRERESGVRVPGAGARRE